MFHNLIVYVLNTCYYYYLVYMDNSELFSEMTDVVVDAVDDVVFDNINSYLYYYSMFYYNLSY